jgi:hypothetical protein
MAATKCYSIEHGPSSSGWGPEKDHLHQPSQALHGRYGWAGRPMPPGPTTQRHGDPPATKWVSFSYPLVSIPSQWPHKRSGKCSGSVFILPCGGVFGMPWDDLSFTASTEAVPATPVDTASEIRPLTSPPPIPVLAWDPCGGCLGRCWTFYSTGDTYPLYTPPHAVHVQLVCQHRLPVYTYSCMYE